MNIIEIYDEELQFDRVMEGPFPADIETPIDIEYININGNTQKAKLMTLSGVDFIIYPDGSACIKWFNDNLSNGSHVFAFNENFKYITRLFD